MQEAALDPIICLACLETREDIGPCRRCASGAYVFLSDLIRQILDRGPATQSSRARSLQPLESCGPVRSPTSIRAMLDGE